MGFVEAIQSGLRKYVEFEGRACRSEYWYFHLFTFLVILIGVITGPFVILIGLALFLPTLAVNVRRLHDINRSGWYIFIACVPLIGPIILLIWHCERGTYGDNRFGPDLLQNWI